MNRRKFLYQSSVVSFGFLSLSRCVNKKSTVAEDISLPEDPKGYLDLPEGFSYKVISSAGNKMKDGLLVPGRADGMGSFLGEDGKVILIRNHENSPDSVEYGAFGKEGEVLTAINISMLYDAGKGQYPGLGGTTTLIYDEQTGEVIDEYMSLGGTYRNCAGGSTPWNSWLTCEEDVTRADGNFVEKDHGYVFEVPAGARGLVNAKPITGMGRFNHEAVAVDPETNIIYQTEDRPDGLVYRFIPDNPRDLHEGGKLQVLAVKNMAGLDTRNWESKSVKSGEKLPVAWLDIDDVLSPEDDLRYRGFEIGAARFARGEGMWYGDKEIYFACTNGGPKKLGQVFKFDLRSDTLELFAESEDKSVLHMCDNLTISPQGVIVLCEDNGELNRIHFIDKKGEIKLLAINRSSASEFAGAVFSPSGKTLFVNIQENGDTIAITGPWDRMFS